MAAVWRWARAAAVAAGLVAALAASAAPAPAAADERAAGCITPEGEVAVGQVLVAVAFPSRVATACAAPGGSGIDVLRSAGFTVVASGYGSVGGAAAVCAIEDPRTGEQVGCATGPSCLTCASPDYWQYYRCWVYSAAGGGATSPAGGTIEGWRWGRSSSWPAGSRPASCDSDGDDVAAPVVPPPPPPPSSPDRPRADPSRPPSGGGTAPGSDPADPGPGSPAGPGADPGGAEGTTEPSGTGTTSPAAPGDRDEPGSPDGAAPAADDGEDGPSRHDATGPGRDEASGPLRPGDGGGGPGDPGGGGWVPLAGTAAVVAALGIGAVGLRRRRRAGVTAAAGAAPQG